MRELLTLAPEQLTHEITRWTHGMDEVAVAATCTLAFVILTTAGFAEIRHWRELAHDGASCVEPTVELGKCVLCILLAVELGVQVACEMICRGVLIEKIEWVKREEENDGRYIKIYDQEKVERGTWRDMIERYDGVGGSRI